MARLPPRLLSDDFLGVYTVGFSDRAGHVAQLADGPTVSEYSLGEARLMALSDDMVLLAYRAEFRRPGEEAPESVLISSIWQDAKAGGSTSSAKTHRPRKGRHWHHAECPRAHQSTRQQRR